MLNGELDAVFPGWNQNGEVLPDPIRSLLIGESHDGIGLNGGTGAQAGDQTNLIYGFSSEADSQLARFTSLLLGTVPGIASDPVHPGVQGLPKWLLDLILRHIKDLTWDPGRFPLPPEKAADIIKELGSGSGPKIIIERGDLGDELYAKTTQNKDGTITICFNTNPNKNALKLAEISIVLILWHELLHAWLMWKGEKFTDEARAPPGQVAIAASWHAGIYFSEAMTACKIACDKATKKDDRDVACEMFKFCKAEAVKDFKKAAGAHRARARALRSAGNTSGAETAENQAASADEHAADADRARCKCCPP